nr:nicotinate-nucleotide adenylyltransferase [Ardenticatena sp.]
MVRVNQRVGIFGGTFDPPHLGHLLVAELARDALQLDMVSFMPAGKPPHKYRSTPSAGHHRVAMLQLAIAGNPAFDILTLEVEANRISYTADTLATLRHTIFTHDETLYFIMGGDSLAYFHTWREPGRILHLARLAVIARPGWTIDLETLERHLPAARGRVDIVEAPLIEISSSDIRRRVREGRTIRYFVPDAVADYIYQQHLYIGMPSPETEGGHF